MVDSENQSLKVKLVSLSDQLEASRANEKSLDLQIRSEKAENLDLKVTLILVRLS